MVFLREWVIPMREVPVKVTSQEAGDSPGDGFVVGADKKEKCTGRATTGSATISCIVRLNEKGHTLIIIVILER